MQDEFDFTESFESVRNSFPKKYVGISNHSFPDHLQQKDVMTNFYETICGNDDGDGDDTEKAVTKDGNKWRRMCRSLEQLCHQGKSATKDLQKCLKHKQGQLLSLRAFRRAGHAFRRAGLQD